MGAWFFGDAASVRARVAAQGWRWCVQLGQEGGAGRGGEEELDRSTSVTVLAGGASRGTSNKGRGGYRFLKSGPSGNGSWRSRERKLTGSKNNLEIVK